MKIHLLLFIISVSLCNYFAEAQQLDDLIVPYGTRFIANEISCIPRIQTGIRLTDQGLEHPWSKFDQMDSNSLVKMNYAVVPAVSQEFRVNLYRPISKKSTFDFTLSRLTSSGWMLHSLGQENSIGVKVDHRFNRNWRSCLATSYLKEAFEQNGGLISSSYTSNIGGGALDKLNNDIQIVSPSFFREKLDVDFGQVLEIGDRVELHLNNWLCNAQNVFSDPAPSSTYYLLKGFRMANEVKDRYADNTIGSAFKIVGLSPIDSVRNVYTSLGYTLKDHNIRNNGFAFRAANHIISPAVSFQGNRINASASADFFLDGISKGNYGANLNLGYDLNPNSKELKPRYQLGFKMSMMSCDAAMIFYRYNSDLGNVRNVFSKVGNREIIVFAKQEHSFASLTLESGIGDRRNHVYLDSNWTARQALSPIFLVKNRISVKLSGKRMTFITAVMNQYTNTPEILSRPAWVVSSSIVFKHTLFASKVLLEHGHKLLYYSKYFAQSYAIIYNQFASQSQIAFTYAQMDSWVALLVGQARLSINLNNWTYGLLNKDVMIAPNYPAIPRHIMLSVDWLLKN